MYNPKPSDVMERLAELLGKAKLDDDILIDALIANIILTRALLVAENDDDRSWYQTLLNNGINHHVIGRQDLYTKATNELIAEAGTVVQTAVDDWEFKPHDTRI